MGCEIWEVINLLKSNLVEKSMKKNGLTYLERNYKSDILEDNLDRDKADITNHKSKSKKPNLKIIQLASRLGNIGLLL